MAERATLNILKPFAILGALTAGLMLGACAQSGEALQAEFLAPKSAPAEPATGDDSKVAQTELEKATEYWGKKFREQPRDLDAALSFAKNLKAMGEKKQALAVVQQAAVFHGNDKKLASEYGRLALELEQISVAKQMLAVADDPTAPDWRVVSARGTVLAKEGKFADAIEFYERALTLSQDQTSVMNNLAMAYAGNGDAAKAEAMLRQAEAKGGSAKTRQNLALVLGLQGKFDEAKTVSSADLGDVGAKSNSDYLRKMVKVDPAANPVVGAPVGTKVAKAGKAGKAVAAQAAPVSDVYQPGVGDAPPVDENAPTRVSASPNDALVLKGMTR
jgi:Flp pilus assembly protein TadD